ncbi:hypothetical protein N7462_007547 [Penicillium macrosclerotiorum]|uniref:uncharacterized protein n=1 Tax=Penicillium macrosclerotiorum TaxID=303699 RepID=UPI0025481E26|nr:uncharacterized protein N7462_007547 [Penicillium macrosclerotiorum]KAJ5679303.1 hypothetical protein N7462_007547 [Penicillium macrosclerotiorum]
MSCLSSDSRSITSRPKLTLQTSSLPRTFGSSNTGLSLSFATAPTASPTVRNTFKNAYEIPSPSSATSSPSKTLPSHRFPSSKSLSPYVHFSSNTTTATNSPFSSRSPYQLPLGVRSILRNSPIERASRGSSVSTSSTGPGGAGARRVFFPAKKQVSYRHPLEEVIRTDQYTAQHLDLLKEDDTAAGAVQEAPAPEEPTPDSTEDDDSDSASLLSSSETSSASSDDVSLDGQGTAEKGLSKLERKKRRTLGAERQVRAVALLDGFASADYPSIPPTPRHSRVKRRREWKWTLGPIDGKSQVEDDLSISPAQIELPRSRSPVPVEPPPELNPPHCG